MRSFFKTCSVSKSKATMFFEKTRGTVSHYDEIIDFNFVVDRYYL